MFISSLLRSYLLPGTFHTGEFAVVSSWLIRLRWVAVAVFFLLALFFSVLAPNLLPVRILYSVCLILFLYNLVFFIFSQTKSGQSSKGPLYSTRLQVLLDWIALLIIVHLTGGVFSPLIFFFILHVIINAMIFRPRHCYVYTMLSLMGLGTLFFLENFLVDFSSTTSWLGTSFQELNLITLLFAFSIYAFILFTATFLATSIMTRFRERENDVLLLSRRLQESLTRMETLYETTKTMASRNDIDAILDIIAQESTRIMHAKGAIIRLVREAEEELAPTASFGLSETFLNKGPVKRGDGIFPRNFDEVVMVEDVQTDPRIVYPREAVEEGVRSIVSIPLAYKGEVKGDLRLYSAEPRRFTTDEISFLKILANDVAVSLDNVKTWRKLEKTNKKNILLAHKMSHDLRAPVFAVQSLLSAVTEGYAGDISQKQQDILKRCIAKQEQLLVLIKDVLSLAEGQATAQDQNPVGIRLDEVAQETVKLFEMLFQKKGVSIKYISPPAPLVYRETPGDFQRLFSNLLENALRYTPEGGRVEFALQRNAEHISILVKDTGIGIEPAEIDKIFDEFHRTARAKKIVQDGTGLGLPIVKSIVNRYNGFINIESRPGKGTAFSITIPCAR